MKKTILILLVIAAIISSGQVKCTSFTLDSNRCFSIIYSSVFAEDIKGKIYVYSDSMTAIKKLFELWHQDQKKIHELDSLNNSLWKLIEAGKNFTNQVPDYFKSAEGNCKWPAYKKQLLKNGYKITHSKTNIAPCK